MAKFDRMVKKLLHSEGVSQETLAKGIEDMKYIRAALLEGMTHYADQEKLNNWQEPWYANARDSYESKLQKLDAVLLALEAKRVSLPTN